MEHWCGLLYRPKHASIYFSPTRCMCCWFRCLSPLHAYFEVHFMSTYYNCCCCNSTCTILHFANRLLLYHTRITCILIILYRPIHIYFEVYVTPCTIAIQRSFSRPYSQLTFSFFYKIPWALRHPASEGEPCKVLLLIYYCCTYDRYREKPQQSPSRHPDQKGKHG